MKKYDVEDARMAHERGEKPVYVLASDAQKAIKEAFASGMQKAVNLDGYNTTIESWLEWGEDYARRVMEDGE